MQYHLIEALENTEFANGYLAAQNTSPDSGTYHSWFADAAGGVNSICSQITESAAVLAEEGELGNVSGLALALADDLRSEANRLQQAQWGAGARASARTSRERYARMVQLLAAATALPGLLRYNESVPAND